MSKNLIKSFATDEYFEILKKPGRVKYTETLEKMGPLFRIQLEF